MSDSVRPKTNAELTELERRFRKRYILKKSVNALCNLFVSLLGLSAILYSVFVNGMDLFDRLRYMTFDGTIYTCVISFLFAFLCLYELIAYTEVTSRRAYFLRLSSAVTEMIILIFILIGLSPALPDQPDISSYTGIVMHLVIPAATVLTFSLNDAPIGRLKRFEPFYGTLFISLYAALFTFLFASGILPCELAPYSFFDFRHTPFVFSLLCLLLAYVLGFILSIFLSFLNRKLSWIWFYGIQKDL